MKNLTPLLLVLLVSYLIGSGFTAEETKPTTLTLTIPAGEYQVSDAEDGYAMIEMEGFGALGVPGQPQLPAKTFMIALPPGAKVQGVNITGKGPVPVPGTYKIVPAQPGIPGGLPADGAENDVLQRVQTEWQTNYDVAYASDELYPQEVGVFLGQGQWRKYTYARVAFHPFQYQPRSGRLLFYPSCTVSIDYVLPDSGSAEWRQMQGLLSDDVLDDVISRWLINYQQAQTWYRPPSSAARQSDVRYDYVIIVKDNDTIPAVAPLKAWKEKIGHLVNVVTLDYIYANYQGCYSYGKYAGCDDAAKIWDFLHDKYPSSEWGIRYVLLVGDVDVLPMRMLYPGGSYWGDGGGYGSDYYYAKVSVSKWDGDEDKRWGEFLEDDFDKTPDVLVGRIPFNDSTVVNTICTNIVNFEKDTGSWKRQALLAHGQMGYTLGTTNKTDGAFLAEYMKEKVFTPKGWSCTTLYEKNGLLQGQSQYTCTHPLTDQNLANYCQPQAQSVVNLSAHGCPTFMQSWYWLTDIDKDGVVDATEDKDNNFSTIGHIPSTSAVVVLDGCSTGPLFGKDAGFAASKKYSLYLIQKTADSITKRYLRNGAVAALASTAGMEFHPTWSTPADGKSQSLNYYFYDQLINQDKKVGDAFYDAHLEYANKHGLDRSIRVYNLFGDPSLALQGIDDRPGGPDTQVHEGKYWDFAADNSDGGDMYVAVLTTNAYQQEPGEIKVYKSTNHGQSWSLWRLISDSDGFYDVDVIVADADNRLLVFYTDTGGRVRVYRYPLAGGSPDIVTIQSWTAPHRLRDLSAARNLVAYSSVIHLIYETHDETGGEAAIHVCRSLDHGATWQDCSTFTDFEQPSVDAGPNIYLAARKDSSPYDIYFTRSFDAGANWETWTNLTANDGAVEHEKPVVASTTGGVVPTVWVAYNYMCRAPLPPPYVVLRGGIRYAYSLNAGAIWTTDQALSGFGTTTGGDNASARFVHLKGYKAGINSWMNVAYNYNPGTRTQILWRYAHGGTPSTWSAPRMVNDFEPVMPVLAPRVVYSPGASASGSGVVYGTQGSGGPNYIYFSAPWLTSAPLGAEEPHQKRDSVGLALSASSQDGTATIRFSIQGNEQVTVMIHDAAGKLVRTLVDEDVIAGSHEIQWDGRANADNPAPVGRYLCTLRTSRGAVSKEFVLKAGKAHPAAQAEEPAPLIWFEAGELDQAFIVSSLLQTSEGVIYAGTTAREEAKNGGAVFRSSDGGATWERLGALTDCWSLSCVFRSSDGSLFAGGLRLEGDQAQGVIYRSADDGGSWEPALVFPNGVVYDLTETAEGHLYAATGWNGLLFRSEDGGLEWVPVAEFGGNVHTYAIMQASNGNLFAALELPEGTGQIMRSENEGVDWAPAEGLDGVVAVYDLLESSDRLYAGVRGTDRGWVYQSDLEGLSWARTGELPHSDVKAVHCLLQGPLGEIFTGTEMRMGPSFTRVFVTQSQGEHWQEFGGPIDLANTVYALVGTSDMVYAGTGRVYGNVYKCGLQAARPYDIYLPLVVRDASTP